ncbi:FAFR253Wp [Eremothecium gossypii FDAG1]|nr:FAFR253Wp [Eremothecium gossypii FDAG1]
MADGTQDGTEASLVAERHGVRSSVIAGAAAAVFQTTMSHPFEFLKTGQQLHRALPGAAAFNMLHPFKYYFSGCAALNVGTLLKTGTRFATFEQACVWLRDPEHADQPIAGPRLLLAGAITGFLESLWVVPFESIKTTAVENALELSRRVQGEPETRAAAVSKGPAPKATFHAVRPVQTAHERWLLHYERQPSSHFAGTVLEIYRTRGVRGFLQGAMPTIFRQLGNSVVRFTTYAWIVQSLSPHKALDEYQAFAAGALSSAAVVALTQPIDVIKTRMQSKTAWFTYKSSLNCAYRIFVEEGFRYMWKGWVPRLFKVSLSGGISFGVYQYVENLVLLWEHERSLAP